MHRKPSCTAIRTAAKLYSVLAWSATVLAAAASETQPATSTLASVMREGGEERARMLRCNPGPWGRVEYVNSFVEAPAQLVADVTPPDPGNRWHMAGIAPTSAPPLLAAAGLDTDTVRALLATAQGSTTNGAWTLHPSDEWILSLAPDQRNRLYGLLGRLPGNDLMRYPHRFEARDREDWILGEQLRPGTRDLLSRLVYRRGDLALFSDVGPALRLIESAPERRAVLQMLHRQPTVIARLRVDPSDDVAGLVAYWGERGRQEDVAPLLESVQSSQISWTVNVAMLLPSWPRQMLLKYDLDPRARFRDCHWTSMNFFNAQPDERYLDPSVTRDTVIRDYVRVREGFRLGDLILLRDKRAQVVHSCNYVADNLVFTKNGGEAATPWTLMTLEDVIDYYALGEPLDVVFLRRQE